MKDEIYYKSSNKILACLDGFLYLFMNDIPIKLNFAEFVREIDIIPELSRTEKRAIVFKMAENQGCFA